MMRQPEQERVASLQHLRQHLHSPGVDGGHPLLELFCQIATTQMNVEQGCLGIAMACKGCNLMQIPIGKKKICKAKMAQGMRRELGDSRTICNTLDHL